MIVTTDVKPVVAAIMYRCHQHCLKSLMEMKKILVKCKWEKVRFKKQNKIIHCSAILVILLSVLLKEYKNVKCVDQNHPWKLVVCLSSTVPFS